jgi:hypothetical protein
MTVWHSGPSGRCEANAMETYSQFESENKAIAVSEPTSLNSVSLREDQRSREVCLETYSVVRC